MPVTSVPTRPEQTLGRPLRGRVSVRWSPTVALLGALALPGMAWAQVPAGAADSGLPSVPVHSAPSSPDALAIQTAPPIAAVSSLPAGIFAQARAGALELLSTEPTGGKVVVIRLPLTGSKFDTLCIGSYLYVARNTAEILVLDVHDPRQPKPIASFQVGGAVTTLWGGPGSLMVARGDGATLLFDISDPTHPRYQSVIATSVAAVPSVISGREEAPRELSIRKAYQSRLAVSLRPFMFFANRRSSPTSYGTLIDFSYQFAQIGGLWWGIEIAPVIINSYYDGVRGNSRAWFGYAGERFALAGAMGAGVTDDSTWLQFGAAARLGRITGVHGTLRLMWSVFAPYRHPTSGEFNLEGPVSQRLGLRYNFTGDSALSGFHTTLGLQFFVGGDHRWRTTVLTPAVGFMYMRTQASTGSALYVHHPGVIFSFTFEPRTQ